MSFLASEWHHQAACGGLDKGRWIAFCIDIDVQVLGHHGGVQAGYDVTGTAVDCRICVIALYIAFQVSNSRSFEYCCPWR